MPPSVGSHAILVVEDHNDLRELVVLFLRSRGYEVMQAANGADAIQKAVSSAPKFVLLDIRLPDMNGVEVARHILRLRPTIPIVGWTADYVSASYMQTLLEAGFIDCLQKPFSLSEVLKLVERYAPKP
jgi:CheY-like chemotaxis protein